MTEPPEQPADSSGSQQAEFEKISGLVKNQFEVEEALVEHDVPTYYLKQPQETKQPFLNLLKSLEPMELIAVLRRVDERIVLRVVKKPQARPSNVKINWILFFATIVTTFLTGYMLSDGLVANGTMPSPLVGGATFSAAIMIVLGMHEMGHKLTANRRNMDATPPYFIPGPPPIGGSLGIGTFGAVIMQKSLPPNRDALFDIGANGPIVGFVLASIVAIIGLAISPVAVPTGNENFLATPLIFEVFLTFIIRPPAGSVIMLHPVAFAGWVGMFVTMLNLLPAAMLDGGHVTKSLFGEKTRMVLTALSILYLIAINSYVMAIFVLFLSMFRHPGPLDDVSGLSGSRKLAALGLAAIFVLCSFPLFGF